MFIIITRATKVLFKDCFLFRLRRRKYRKYTTYEAQQSNDGGPASSIHHNETVENGISSTNGNGISVINGNGVTSINSNGLVNILSSSNKVLEEAPFQGV